MSWIPAKLKQGHAQIAIAVCAVDLGRSAPSEIKLTPTGRFKARDGRPHEVPEGWYMDAMVATAVIGRASRQADDFLIDYEHQTLYTKDNGQDAPAAGWFKTLEWRDGDGLYATDVRWTARASQMIADGEYRYLSPVLYYDPNTGEVLAIVMAALVNYAAIDGLDGLAAQAAAKFSFDTPNPRQEDDTVDRKQLIALLGLAENASDEDINRAMTALKAKADQVDGLQGQITALKAEQPDPAQFVPLSSFESLKGELAALRGEVTANEVTALVAQGIDEGKLLPVQEQWATDLGNRDLAALKGYLDKTPAIAALKGSQTGGKAPDGDADPVLDEAALAVCKQMSIEPDEYAKTLAG